ncbi:hypothetical protein [Streptococcus hyovaginalis]
MNRYCQKYITFYNETRIYQRLNNHSPLYYRKLVG